MITEIDAVFGVSPIGHPAEIRWVDVRRDPVFESMQLVRTDKMHFSGQAGVVAHEPQIVGECGHGRGHVGGVVITGAAGNVLAGHQCVACRGAQRTRAVSGIELHTLRGQLVDMWAFDVRVIIAAEREGGELIGHDDEHIGLFVGHGGSTVVRRLRRLMIGNWWGGCT